MAQGVIDPVEGHPLRGANAASIAGILLTI